MGANEGLQYVHRPMCILDSVIATAIKETGYLHARRDAFADTEGKIFDLAYLFSDSSHPSKEGDYSIPSFSRLPSPENLLRGLFSAQGIQQIFASSDGQVRLYRAHVSIDGKIDLIDSINPEIINVNEISSTVGGRNLFDNLNLL